MDLSYLRIVGRRPCSQLSCNSKGHCVSRTSRSVGSVQNVDCVYIAPIGRGGKAELYSCARKISVMSLFSPNKLIDYSPAFGPFTFTLSYRQDTYVLLSNPFVFFTPLPYPSSAQRRTKREDCLHLASQTYGRFTGRIRFIPLFLCSGRYLWNIPLRPSSLSGLSVLRCGVSTNTGTTACLRCSRMHLDAQPCSSAYARSRSSIQC